MDSSIWLKGRLLSSGRDGASELILLATASIEGENQAQFV